MKTTAKKTTKPAPATKPTKSELPAGVLDKMAKWNKANPDAKISFVVIGKETPTEHQTCRTCQKKFRHGRITRIDSKGAYCGPKCQTPKAK